MAKSIKSGLKKSGYLIPLVLISYFVYIHFFHDAENNQTKGAAIAPEFTLKDLDGNIHSLSDYSGSGVVVNFWATYCPPCQKEMPTIEKAYQEFQDQGIEVLAINVGEPALFVHSFISKNNVSFPILLDRDEQVSKTYGVLNLPITLFIKDGEIMEEINGELTEQTLRDNMEKMITK
ncbi:MAG: thiol-disulfide oxidoreductase ResA [Bacilli bacterium]|uniref:Thiol-disulfide oxidoreductase ResA n=1 Tax=Ureibacillus suwonensis TaxID=313007 RepID=A0ABW0RAS7_9BACL|nr:alkyl hydroperoxide reductase [Bacilli bacterium]